MHGKHNDAVDLPNSFSLISHFSLFIGRALYYYILFCLVSAKMHFSQLVLRWHYLDIFDKIDSFDKKDSKKNKGIAKKSCGVPHAVNANIDKSTDISGNDHFKIIFVWKGPTFHILCFLRIFIANTVQALNCYQWKRVTIRPVENVQLLLAKYGFKLKYIIYSITLYIAWLQSSVGAFV